MLWAARACPPPAELRVAATPLGVQRARTHPSGSFPAAVAGCHEQRQRGLLRSWRSGPDAGCGRRRWRVLEPLSAFSRAPAPRHGHAPGSVPCGPAPLTCALPGLRESQLPLPLKKKTGGFSAATRRPRAARGRRGSRGCAQVPQSPSEERGRGCQGNSARPWFQPCLI